MLKGLSRILKSAAQVALPIALSATPLGPVFGAAAGSGIASLLAGAKPKDALLQAGLAGLGGAAYSKFAGPAAGNLADGNAIRQGNEMIRTTKDPGFFSRLVQKAKAPVFSSPDGKAFGPSGFTTAAMIGIPSALAYMGAAQDARRAQPMDPKDYRSYVDDLYGGPVARPPEDRRITNLNPLTNLPHR